MLTGILGKCGCGGTIVYKKNSNSIQCKKCGLIEDGDIIRRYIDTYGHLPKYSDVEMIKAYEEGMAAFASLIGDINPTDLE